MTTPSPESPRLTLLPDSPPPPAAPPGPGAAPRLTQAQLVVARELGFGSWARLRREVQLTPLRRQLERLVVRDWRIGHDVSAALAAAWALGRLPRDPRAGVALHDALRSDADPQVQRAAHRSLKQHSPEYRRRADAAARAAGLARAGEAAPADALGVRSAG